MAKLELGNCVYRDKYLCLIKKVKNDWVHAEGLEINIFGRGYVGYNDIIVYPTWVKYAQQIDLNLYTKIKKLLYMNYVSCQNLIDRDNATASSNIEICHPDFGKNLHIISVDHNIYLNISDNTAAYNNTEHKNFSKYISMDTYKEVNEKTLTTLKLIDNIWPNKNS